MAKKGSETSRNPILKAYNTEARPKKRDTSSTISRGKMTARKVEEQAGGQYMENVVSETTIAPIKSQNSLFSAAGLRGLPKPPSTKRKSSKKM